MLRVIFLVLLFISSSCTYNELITGCIDPSASNYDPNATIDNGLCILDSCISEPSFLECVKPIIDNNCVGVNISEEKTNDPKQEYQNPKNKKIGRNEPCFCNSGKKFKHCHGVL